MAEDDLLPVEADSMIKSCAQCAHVDSEIDGMIICEAPIPASVKTVDNQIFRPGIEWAMRVPRVEWEETAARCRCFRRADRGFALPLKETQDAVHAVAVMARTRATAANQRPEPCAGYVALELGKFADDVDALNQLGKFPYEADVLRKMG